jgi:ABC-2 type transport system permease protein
METPPHESRTVKALRLTARQALMEQRNFWRSPEYALFTFALPLFLLLLLGAANGGSYLPGHIRQIKVLVPSILAFGVIAAAYANLGAKMAVLRHDGVLKRIRTTPLPSGAYLIGLIVSTVVTSVAIAGCTALAGWLAFGTAPRLDGMFLLGFGLALGIVCFAALGLAVSSLIKSAESAGPITNAIYLPIVMISGIFDPTIGIPRWMSAGAGALPIKALAEVLEDAYTPAAHAFPAVALVTLLAWAVAAAAFTAWRFRWQPA